MEDLLTPQICMDVDETPLDVGKGDTTDDENTSESGEPEMDDDEKVKTLLEEKFTDSAQVPEELTEFEKDAKKNVFAIGEPAVQFQRLHCTACNIHLGSAPTGHFNRYIHPLLKVLLCKSCYEFYCSGEFDKDEDGSEMYCRWCGQGGKVMCCAQCAYVFCQKCVRQNLGKRTLELIKDSDDWLCFGCNPTQLINLKIICTSLFEFVQEEIRLSKSLNNIERLKIDHAVCCQKVKTAKRKRDEDAVFNPYKHWEEQQKAKKINIFKNTMNKSLTTIQNNVPAKTWNQKEEAEVVCTPDLLSLMEDDPPPLTPMPKSAQTNNVGATNSILSQELTKAPLNTIKEPIPLSSKAFRSDTKKLFTIAPKTANMMMICNSNNFQKTTPNFIRLQTPAIKFLPSMSRTPIVNSVPAQITPGTKHEWYDRAATVVSTITGNLSVTLNNLTKEQRNAKTVEQLANIHNKLQELLSSSVNSLIQVRKNLRSEFLADLNKLKFSNAPTFASRPTSTSNVIKARPQNMYNKENDDDDVIIINSESPSQKSGMTEPPPLVKFPIKESKLNSRPYLKVRSVSQLLTVSSECITIPDDPPGQTDDVIPVEEKDPLALPDTPLPTDKQSSNSTAPEIVSSNEVDKIKMKNALTESRIEELVRENMKYQVEDIADDELKRILSVRVLLATNFQDILPENRLKTASWFVDTDVIEETHANKTINIETEPDVSDKRTLPTENQKTASEDVTAINNNENKSPVPMDTDEVSNDFTGNISKNIVETEEDTGSKDKLVDVNKENSNEIDIDKESSTEIDIDKDEEKDLGEEDKDRENTKDENKKDKDIEKSDSVSNDFEESNKKHEDDSNSIVEDHDGISEKDEEANVTEETTENSTNIIENESELNDEGPSPKDNESDLNDDEPNLNDKEPDLNDKEPNLNDKEPNLNDEESTLDDEEPNLDDEEPNSDDEEPNLNDKEPSLNDEEPSLNDEESNSNAEETNSNEEDNSIDAIPTNDAEANFSMEKNTTNVTKTSSSESESDINNSNNKDSSKSDAFASEQITTDSGIEVDSK